MNVKQLLAKTNLKFRDFVALKVGGKDEYSYLGYTALKRRMSAEAMTKTEAALEVHAERAKVYRWILRGLPVDYAIRKVKTDLEVSANAEQAREEEEWWDEERIPAPPEQIEVAGYTLIRPHANKVIITKDGEILAEKEINGDRHFANFAAKFRQDDSYRHAVISENESRVADADGGTQRVK